MVHLSKIYTRSGDDGSTGLGDGTRVPKTARRIEAYGTVDETSSVLGLARTAELPAPLSERLRAIQNDLFDLGADLSVPGRGGEGLRLDGGYVTRLEAWIDEANAPLEALSSFVLPGGTPAAAWLHLARTVCRRAERCIVALLDEEGEEAVSEHALRYVNRLSDLLFVYSRVVNADAGGDVLWEPGENKG